MIQEEKFSKAVKLADAMYYAAQMLSTDASHLRKATEAWWHFENVELNNLFPELAESEDEKIREYLIRYIDNTMKSSELKSKLLAWLEKQGEQKPVEWSEEDEKMFDYALDMIEWYSGKNEDKSRLVSDWLKSLKDRVQPKQEWTEEDEAMLVSIISDFAAAHKSSIGQDKWLKSLKQRIGG